MRWSHLQWVVGEKGKENTKTDFAPHNCTRQRQTTDGRRQTANAASSHSTHILRYPCPCVGDESIGVFQSTVESPVHVAHPFLCSPPIVLTCPRLHPSISLPQPFPPSPPSDNVQLSNCIFHPWTCLTANISLALILRPIHHPCIPQLLLHLQPRLWSHGRDPA